MITEKLTLGENYMISIIVAYTKNRVIGNKGLIPWNIKGEQKRFKELTTENIIVMGKRSFEEIGKPLPNRKTILLSSTLHYESDNCTTVSSLEEAIKLADGKDIYVSGGYQVYKEALPLADRLYITVIDTEIEGDTYFPEFNEEDYIKTFEEKHEGEIGYTYYTYERINKDK